MQNLLSFKFFNFISGKFYISDIGDSEISPVEEITRRSQNRRVTFGFSSFAFSLLASISYFRIFFLSLFLFLSYPHVLALLILRSTREEIKAATAASPTHSFHQIRPAKAIIYTFP